MATSEFSKTVTSSDSKSTSPLVLVGNQNGVTVIPQPTPLTRLNYFDGKFLRASDLNAEQLYLRRLVDISNQAGGPGVVHGYNLSLAAGGDNLNLGPGLAIDPQGRVLLLPEAVTIGVQNLIDKSRQLKIAPSTVQVGAGSFAECTVVTENPPDSVVRAGDLYLITIGFAEALCGQEDVFGKLCEDACITSTDRPYRVEGIILRAVPLQLQTPLPTSAVVALSQLHLRSRVASSYFKDERKKIASFISGDGLRSDVWCFGAEAAGGLDVPLGVIARAGNTTLFLDAWIARRERIDAPAKRYWQWRMAMRPWDVFLAQILQFQCQLAGLFKQQPQGGGNGDDPCASTRTLIREASDTVAKIANFYQAVTTRFTLQPLILPQIASEEKSPTLEGGFTALDAFRKRLEAASAAFLIPSDKFLIDGGIIELPSAGYLPVAPNSVVSVNEQVRRLLGKGVDLRFCIVRPDFVAHALEEAQHMERISLLQGLDDPKNKPKVDILVPNGEILKQKLLSPGLGFEAQLDVNSQLFSSGNNVSANIREVAVVNQNIRFQGAARAEKLSSGGGAIYLGAEFEIRAGSVQSAETDKVTKVRVKPPFRGSISEMFNPINLAVVQHKNPRVGAWISLSCERNIFELRRGDATNFNAQAIVAATTVMNTPVLDIVLNGTLEITQETTNNGGTQTLTGRIVQAKLSFLFQSFNNTEQRKTILVDLGASITLTGGSAIDIVLTYQQNQFKLSANWGKQPMEVTAAIATITNDRAGQPQELILAAAGLKENSDVLSAGNVNHQQALDALDIVAAALRDVNFAAAKARLLFPPPPTPTDDIVVRSTADWVLFHRRREKQCGTVTEAPQTKPPTTYRIFNITARDLANARRIVKQINAELEKPAKFAEHIKKLTNSSVDLVIAFDGDSSTPQFDFRVAETQWQGLNPGKNIFSVFYGSKADFNVALQTNRLRQFESAIGDDSRELADGSTHLQTLMPFPVEASPPDADGIMFFITVDELRKALLIYVNWDIQQDKPQRFVIKSPPPNTIEFRNDTLTDDELNNLNSFIEKLKDQPVLGLTLATVKPANDTGEAQTRLQKVVDALAAKRPELAFTRPAVEDLNTLDRKILENNGQNLDNFHEIIFFESNERP
jgi:hypothetical protein